MRVLVLKEGNSSTPMLKLTLDPEIKCFRLYLLSEFAEHSVLGACLWKTYQMGFAQNKPELPLPLLSNSLVVRAFPKSEDSRFSTFSA